jgi:hypothetical protein
VTQAPASPRPPDLERRTLTPLGYAVAVVVPILVAAIGITILHFNYDPEDVVTGQRVPIMTSDWREGDDAALAEVSGVLTLTPAGCVVLTQPDGSELSVVWPFDFEATVLNQALKLYDTDRTIAARGGDTIAAGGAYGDVGSLAGTPCAPPAGTEVAFVQSTVEVTARG